MDKIKVIKNVIKTDDAALIINYMNRNIDSFVTGGGKRFHKLFGIDEFHKEISSPVVEGVEDITDLMKDTVNSIKKILAHEFNDNDEILLASFWLGKQIPGARVGSHLDVDDGTNSHFIYSAVLYLNTIQDGGVLEFPALDVAIKPEFGDLVIFLSGGEDMAHEVKIINEERYTIPMWFTKNKSLELLFK